MKSLKSKKRVAKPQPSTQWVDEVIENIQFVGHCDRSEAVNLLKRILGPYNTLGQRLTEVNREIYRNFTFHTAEQLFYAISSFEACHLERSVVIDQCTIFAQHYVVGSMGPQIYDYLKGVETFGPPKSTSK